MLEDIDLIGGRRRAAVDAINRPGRSRPRDLLRNRVHVGLIRRHRAPPQTRSVPPGRRKNLGSLLTQHEFPLIREGQLDVGGGTDLLVARHRGPQVRHVATRLRCWSRQPQEPGLYRPSASLGRPPLLWASMPSVGRALLKQRRR